tara:strand:- start:1133 stop:1678 length:546 start_codon:yes stop_codon:yes gene_type:complete
MNNLYKEINFPFPFNFVFPKDKFQIQVGYDFENNLSDEYKNWFFERDIHIGHAHVVNIGPNSKYDHVPIHGDGDWIDNHVKVNYTFCKHPVTINWYGTDEKYLKKSYTPLNHSMLTADEDKYTKIYTKNLLNPNGQCYLFNAGQLHGLEKVESLCTTFCLVIKNKDESHLQWDKAMELFDF